MILAELKEFQREGREIVLLWDIEVGAGWLIQGERFVVTEVLTDEVVARCITTPRFLVAFWYRDEGGEWCAVG